MILSAGSVQTPLLLERSGIGDPEVLRKAGVDLRAESPNVGERVIEQSHLSVQFRLKGNVGETQRLNTPPKQAWEGFKYLFTRRGPIAEPGFNLVAGFESSPDLDRPDIQGQFVPLALDRNNPSAKLADHLGVQFVGFQISPMTTSSIHLGGRLPGNAPMINANYLEDDADRKAIAPVLGIARELFARSPLADCVLEEEVPGPTVSNDEGLQYALNTEASSYHAVGACSMGPNGDDVVDPELRVRGVDGLRVVDASVLPVQVSGNTAAPVMAVAWIAADLILEGS
jgi:choline dehydrogenase-like flavoprotein